MQVKTTPQLIILILIALLAILLWLSPAEKRLGQTVKLVYLHGALVRAAVVLFATSLPINLIALVSKKEYWLNWGKALVFTALGIWLAHTLFSVVTTYATWGVFIAWFEPRTRFTFVVAGVGLLMVTVTHLLDSELFSAVVYALLAALVLGLLPRLGFIQHPLDPIGASTSTNIRGFYTAILGVTLSMGAVISWWIHNKLRTAST